MQFAHPDHRPLLPGQHVSTTGGILAYAASAHPDKTGLIDGDRQWTFGELDRFANRFANAVASKLADDAGPVGIMGRNSVEYAAAHFGAARAGRYTVNLPTRCTEDDLVFVMNRTKPALVVADAGARALLDATAARLEATPRLLAFGGDGAPEDNDFWWFLADAPETPPAVEIDPDAPGSVIFTGGTTGRPKAVLSSQRARAISAMAAVEDFAIDPDEVAGYSVPFTHAAGLFTWFQPGVLAGCTGVIVPRWDPEAFMALAERHGITTIFAVPTQLVTLLDHPAFDPERLRSLRRIVFGGAPITRALIERAEAAMPWMVCERAYGSSETGHLAAQTRAGREAVYDGLNQPGGRLEIEIFTAPGVAAVVGETGEVATRGAHLMTGYLGDDDARAEFFRTGETAGDTDGGWGWMGDLAVRHDGYFTLVGRSKHMILSGGLNIYPAELEEALAGHPDVADCAVVGLDDPEWGEIPVAAVVPAGGHAIDTEAVAEYVAARVARYKRLRRIFTVDAIPRTGAGKIQVHLVQAMCAAARDDEV